MKRKVFIVIVSVLMLFSCAPSKNKNTVEIEIKLGTIVNQKWSEYKYKSHFNTMAPKSSNIEWYSRVIKAENGYYNFSNDIYVRNDSVICQGYNKPFAYNEFLQLDSLLLECNPKNVIGDFTPEGEYMLRLYFFDNLDVEIKKFQNWCTIIFTSNNI